MRDKAEKWDGMIPSWWMSLKEVGNWKIWIKQGVVFVFRCCVVSLISWTISFIFVLVLATWQFWIWYSHHGAQQIPKVILHGLDSTLLSIQILLAILLVLGFHLGKDMLGFLRRKKGS